MKFIKRPSLRDFNSFGIEAAAHAMVVLETEEDLLNMPAYDPARDFILGGGSNVVFATGVPGTVYRNAIRGKKIVDSNDEHAWVETGAGENWHGLVCWSLAQGLAGLENLSLIPGLAGAAPIQNIGAYGVELASILESLTAWDLLRSEWTEFNVKDCKLEYRDSYFKSEAPDRFLITSIRLRLDRKFMPRLEYTGLREELSGIDLSRVTPTEVSDAVIRIRQRRLHDPAVTGNAGSFFKNPVLSRETGLKLLARFPELPAWPVGDQNLKVSAAWMIEKCGLKGHREGGAAVSERHALVIVNAGDASGTDIYRLSREIQTTVESTFGILLEPEPRIVNFQI